MEVTAGSVGVVLAAIAAAFIAAGVLVQAQRILSWVVACAVVAAMIELVVDYLGRWVRRPVAIVLVLLTLGACAGIGAFGVFSDLDAEVRSLQTQAPLGAQSIERSEEFGAVMREIDLDRRVTEAVYRLSSPSSGLAGEAVSSVGVYVVCVVLTILFLSWGPRLANGATRQLQPETAARLKAVFHLAFSRSRRYVALALLQGVIVGLAGWLICLYLDLPAPAPLGLALGVLSLVPTLGIAIGSLPILLLTAGLEPAETTVVVGLLLLALQVVSIFVVQPWVVRKSKLYVGPAVVIIGAMLGFELYGIGGAMYAAALTVLGIAALDVTAETPREITKS